MSSTTTTTKRTTRKAAAPKAAAPKAKAEAEAVIAAAAASEEASAPEAVTEADIVITPEEPNTVPVRTDSESDTSYVVRLMARPSAERVALASSIIVSADREAAVAGFEGRIERSVMAGFAAVGAAEVASGVRPDSFDAVTTALNITAKGGGTFLGRKYSTLRECYDLATVHSAERRESYLATYRAATVSEEYPEGEHAPEQLREYLAWAKADKRGGKTAAKANTMMALVSKRRSAAKAAAKAEANREAKADRTKALVDAGLVDGCPMSEDDWSDMSEETLSDVILLATALASALAEERREEERAERKAEREAKAAAETGPAPAAAPSITVVK